MKYNYEKRVSNKTNRDTTIELNHMRAFKITYWTNSIIIKDLRHGTRRLIAKDFRENSHFDTALKFLNNKLKIEGFTCIDSEFGNFDLIYSLDFETMITKS